MSKEFEVLNKQTFNKIFKNLSITSIKKINDSSKSDKYIKIIIEGEEKQMSLSFEQKVLEFMERIETRLDNIEQDIIDIKSCPTIQKELQKK